MKTGKNITRFLLLFYILVLFALFLYSYTQVDLNLTISRIGFFQNIQKAFQYIGFFQRPLSTVLYLTILAALFVFYFFILRSISHGMMTRKYVWGLVLGGAVILTFSYPAFSYDIFNYMFTAKTILLYHKNPYEVIPLAFIAFDPWIYFMRWVHLPSAYTPIWILLTLPFYLFGFGLFLTTLFSFKLIAAISYLITVWAIRKILDVVDRPHALLGMAIFAFNPLVIIESLVSAHNDIVMMAVASLGLLLFVQKRNVASFFLLSLSAAFKFMTVFTLPVMLATSVWKGIDWRKWSLIAMLAGFFLVVSQREVLPWYWLWIIPFVALLSRQTWLTILSTGVSLGLLLRYAPYLYFGDWNDPVPMIKTWVTVVPIVIAFCVFLILQVLPSRKQ